MIWKFQLAEKLELEGESPLVQRFEMPIGAKLLTIQLQRGNPCLWALIDPLEKKLTSRKIVTYGTGHAIELGLEYVGTYQLLDGALVMHVFDGGEVVETGGA